MLLVTHDMGAVQRFCDRAMLLEHGRVVAIGDPETVGNRYLELNFSAEARAQVRGADDGRRRGRRRTAPRSATGAGRSATRGSRTPRARATTILANGERATFAMRVRVHRDVNDPVFRRRHCRTARACRCSARRAAGRHRTSGRSRAGEEVVWKVSFDNMLGPDRYTITPSVMLARRRDPRGARAHGLASSSRARPRPARSSTSRTTRASSASARSTSSRRSRDEHHRARGDAGGAGRERPPGPQVVGPTAFGHDWRRFWRLAWTLAITDFKLRFFGSVLGYLWQLMRPLLLFGVIYTVFAVILKVGGDAAVLRRRAAARRS